MTPLGAHTEFCLRRPAFASSLALALFLARTPTGALLTQGSESPSLQVWVWWGLGWRWVVAGVMEINR